MPKKMKSLSEAKEQKRVNVPPPDTPLPPPPKKKSFQIKKLNSKNFAHVGFCPPEMLTKFWDFAAGMEFEAQ